MSLQVRRLLIMGLTLAMLMALVPGVLAQTATPAPTGTPTAMTGTPAGLPVTGGQQAQVTPTMTATATAGTPAGLPVTGGQQAQVTPTMTATSTAGTPAGLPVTGALQAQEMPGVTVEDQPILDSRVIVSEVFSDGPGWMVIHADSNGNPGVVLGYAALSDGVNPHVVVAIDEAQATDVLWAMLHADEPQVGVYEFPGADIPVTQNGDVVMESFEVAEVVETPTTAAGAVGTGTPMPTEEGTVEPTGTVTPEAEETEAPTPTAEATAAPTGTVTPEATETETATPTPTPAAGALPETGAAAVTVEDQEIQDGRVIIQEVMGDGPSWVAIHADQDGGPGGLIGVAPLIDGMNSDVPVPIDMAAATETLWVELHVDNAPVGVFHFPGTDVPVMEDGEVFAQSFEVTGLMPEATPTSAAGALPTGTVTPDAEEEETATPTEEATAEATDTMTPEVEEEETATPTEEATAEATDTMTPEATEEGTMTPTPAAGAQVTGTPTAEAAVTPSVMVEDQMLEDGRVVVQEVVSDGPGWLAIHTDEDGSPGPLIGFAGLVHGANSEVVVAFCECAATDTLWAMLHADNPELSAFNFPGVDTPVTLDGEIVMESFEVTMVTPTPEAGAVPTGTVTPMPTGTGTPDAEEEETATPTSAAGAMPTGTVTPEAEEEETKTPTPTSASGAVPTRTPTSAAGAVDAYDELTAEIIDMGGVSKGEVVFTEAQSDAVAIQMELSGFEAGTITTSHRFVVTSETTCDVSTFVTGGAVIAELPPVQFYPSGMAAYSAVTDEVSFNMLAEGATVLIYASTDPDSDIIACGVVQ